MGDGGGAGVPGASRKRRGRPLRGGVDVAREPRDLPHAGLLVVCSLSARVPGRTWQSPPPSQCAACAWLAPPRRFAPALAHRCRRGRHADRDRDLAPARHASSSPRAYAAALDEGRALPLEQAIAEASADTRPEPASNAASCAPRFRYRPAPLETRYARSGDISIAYQVVGSGPIDLVFVMGWVSHMDYFWQEPRFARFLRRLASFARVILFDKRGTGLSDRGVGLPTLEQRMDDVRAVMDAVDSQRAAVVGISEAGALCTLFAATYPERTAALVMVGCFPRRLGARLSVGFYAGGARRSSMAGIETDWASPAWVARDLERRAPSVARDEQFARWWATYLRQSASPGAALAVSRMNNQIDIRPVLPDGPRANADRPSPGRPRDTGRSRRVTSVRIFPTRDSSSCPARTICHSSATRMPSSIRSRSFSPESDRLPNRIECWLRCWRSRSSTHRRRSPCRRCALARNRDRRTPTLVRDQMERFRAIRPAPRVADSWPRSTVLRAGSAAHRRSSRQVCSSGSSFGRRCIRANATCSRATSAASPFALLPGR